MKTIYPIPTLFAFSIFALEYLDWNFLYTEILFYSLNNQFAGVILVLKQIDFAGSAHLKGLNPLEGSVIF